MRSFSIGRHFLPLGILSVLVFTVYLRTMPPGLTWEHWGYDAGDLISSVYTWGIPHPPGTPLYVLLGQLFRLLPFFSNPALKFDFMSVFFGWLSLVVAYLCAFSLTKSRWAASTAALFLAFGPLVWGQSIIAEVLTLNLFLVATTTYLLILWEKSDSLGVRNDLLLRFSLITFGLSLTNHVSALMISPAILFLVLSIAPELFKNGRGLMKLATSFLIGLSPYVYLPIRALMHPALNWGDPSSLSRLISHVTAQEYRGMLFFKSQWLVVDNAFKFVSSLLKNFNPFGFLVGVLGLVFGKRNRIRDFLIFSSLFQLLFVLNYNIVNIETYYLPIFFNFSLFVAFGFLEIMALLGRLRGSVDSRAAKLFAQVNFRRRDLRLTFGGALRFWLLVVIWFSALLNIALYRKEVDLSRSFVTEDYGRGVFKVLEPGAIVLTEGDNYTLSLTYFRYVVFPERTDVAVFHEALFYKLGWMLKQAQRNYPNLRFPRGEVTYDEKEGLKALLEFIELNRKDHPIYLAVGEPPPNPEIAQRSVFADTYVVQSVGPIFKIIDRK